MKTDKELFDKLLNLFLQKDKRGCGFGLEQIKGHNRQRLDLVRGGKLLFSAIKDDNGEYKFMATMKVNRDVAIDFLTMLEILEEK